MSREPGWGRPTPPRGWRPFLVVLWVAGVYAVTLGPQRAPGAQPFEPFSFCLVCGDRGGADLVLNMVLFVPLGLLATARLGVLRTFVTGAALSAAIEVVQLFVPGRFSTFADIAANATGTLLGAGAFLAVAAVVRGAPRGPWASRALALVAGGAIAAGGLLVEPAPTSVAYWGQWTPERPQWTPYEGVVLEAWLDGEPFPDGRLPASWDAPSVMRADWELAGVIRKGPPPRSTSAILAIFDGNREEILFLGADGEDLLMRERLRAQDWGLDRPELVARDALAAAAVGDTVRVAVSREGADRCLGVDGARTCGLGFTPGRLWSLLLYPSNVPAWLQRLADVGWLFALFVPVGLFAPDARNAWASWAGSVVLVGAAVWLTRLAPDLALEPAATATGVATGLALAARFRAVSREAPSGPHDPPPSGPA